MTVQIQISSRDKVWVEISKDAVRHNVGLIRKMMGEDITLLAVVKANAYGLGLAPIARVLFRSGVNYFGVSHIAEGVLLRKILPDASILILGPSFRDHVEDILTHNLVPMVSSLELLGRIHDVAVMMGKRAKVHLMIDTGMGRIGLWHEKEEDFFRELRNYEGVEIEGVASHFASSDAQNLDFAKIQLARFQEFLFHLQLRGIQVPIRHMANSSAFLRLPDSRLNMVRLGLLLYGYHCGPIVKTLDFKPALVWKTKIAFIKDVEPGRPISYDSAFVASQKTRIATLPVGYYQGFSRSLSNTGYVLVGGKKCRVAGRVTMDQVMIDLGLDTCAKVDDEVVLIGQQGGEEIRLEDFAQWAGTIPYEILCRLQAPKYYA